MKVRNLLYIGAMSLLFASCGANTNTADTTSTAEVAEVVEPVGENTDVTTEEVSEPTVETEQVADEADVDKTADSATEVTIIDAHGEVTVPKNPQRVVALDNRTFEILENFGIDLVAAPKDIMPASSSYKNDDSIENIGNHREPNLEILAAADPDLVIVGQRFASYYEDIKELAPNAAVVDFDVDVSEEAESPGENLIQGFITTTLSLGEIFDKQAEAEKLIADLEESLDRASAAYNGESVMALVVSGGEIGFSAPKYGRVWGPVYEILDLKPALEVDGDSSDHKGDDISVEAIAESNPAYLLVLDRDAATSDAADSQPAEDVIENSQALNTLDVIAANKVYYAPKDTYTNESIITFIEIFNGLADLFQK